MEPSLNKTIKKNMQPVLQYMANQVPSVQYSVLSELNCKMPIFQYTCIVAALHIIINITKKFVHWR